MPVCLAPYIGSGVHGDPFRPRGSDQPGWSAIDLRPDASKIDGLALLHLPTPDPDPLIRVLAADKAERFGVVSRQRFRSLLGVQDDEADDIPGLARAILFRGDRRPGLCRPCWHDSRGIRRIYLNRELIAYEEGGPVVLDDTDPTDSGAGADADPIGGNWTTVPGAGSLRRVSNSFASSASADSCAYWNAATAPNDQFSEVKFTTLSDGDAGPACRCSTSAMTFYMADGVGSFALMEFVAGVFSILGTGNTAVNNDVLRLTITGTSLTSTLNGGAGAGPVTDTSIASGRWGIWAFTDTVRMQNWQGGPDAAGNTPYNPWPQLGPILAQ